LRPAVIFGGEDILINNIAWTLRYFPVFGLFGDGSYRLRPIHVEDLAALAETQGAGRENRILDAVGPETYNLRELVNMLSKTLGVRRLVMGMPARLAFAVTRVISLFVGDVMMTWPEVRGLMDGLLYTDAPSTGTIRLSEWAREHKSTLGKKYASEMARRRNRFKAY
jgi:NADH dehydrogenase